MKNNIYFLFKKDILNPVKSYMLMFLIKIFPYSVVAGHKF